MSAVKPRQALRQRGTPKRPAAVQPSELASRVPASTVQQQQVRQYKLLRCTCFRDELLRLLLFWLPFACIVFALFYSYETLLSIAA